MLNDQTTAAAATDAEAADAAALDATTTTQGDASAAQLEQLLVLSQSPLSLADALQKEADRDDDAVPAPLTAGGLLKRFFGLLALFLGVGLVTATVRHYADSPKLYLGAALGGALLFAAGSVVLDPRARRDGAKGLVRFVGLSALLAIGFGLLVGGTLHFSAVPHTGAVIIPLGLALAIGAFLARDGRGLVGRDLMSAGVTVAGLLVWLGVGLGLAAKKIDPAPKPPVAAAHGAPAEGHGAAAAGEHGAAAAGEHGAAAEGDHGAASAAGEHGAAAEGDHGAAAAKAEHGETAAKAEHDAAPAKAEHGESAAADHTETPAKAEHESATESDHGAASASASHGQAAASGHGESTTKAAAKPEEDEVTAADVLVPRRKH